MTRGRVIHTGQAVVDLVMEIDAIPEPGGDTFARHYEFAAGGGFNVMAAAARDDASVVYVGGHGRGTFGDLVRTAMAREGIAVLSPVNAEVDTGFSVALVDDSAERTFISTLGAEGRVSADDYRAGAPLPGDVVYVSGYSLLHPANRAALLEWLPELPPAVGVVVDPSPVIGQVRSEVLRAVAARATVWSSNAREAGIVGELLGVEPTAAALARALHATVILRNGARSSVVAVWEAAGGELALTEVPALVVAAVDTNGAGDAHCGVLCAELAAGNDPVSAVRRAAVAAGVAVTRRGAATSPTRKEIDAALHLGGRH